MMAVALVYRVLVWVYEVGQIYTIFKNDPLSYIDVHNIRAALYICQIFLEYCGCWCSSKNTLHLIIIFNFFVKTL